MCSTSRPNGAGWSSRWTCLPQPGPCRPRSRKSSSAKRTSATPSRTRLNTTNELDRQVIAQAAQRLIAKLPPALRDDPDVRALARLRCESAVDVVHLIYRSKHYESQSKDYEFSRLSMQEHWQAGRADMAHTLRDPRWLNRERSASGVHVFDLTSDGPSTSEAMSR